MLRFHAPSPQQPTNKLPIPDSILINGQGRFSGGPLSPLAVVSVMSQKRYRFRLISIACVPNYVFSIDGHDMVCYCSSECYIFMNFWTLPPRQLSRLMATTSNPFLSTLSRYLQANAILSYWPLISLSQTTGFVPAPMSVQQALRAASILLSSGISMRPPLTLLHKRWRQLILC